MNMINIDNSKLNNLIKFHWLPCWFVAYLYHVNLQKIK